MQGIARGAIAVLLGQLVCCAASAADIRLDPDRSGPTSTILLSGPVIKGDLIGMQDAIEQTRRGRPGKPIVVVLDSPGGHHFEGMLIALLLKRQGIGTVVPPGASCVSACSSIFFGGFNAKAGKPNRVAYETAQVGVHRMRRADGRDASAQEAERVVGGAGWFLDQMGVSRSLQIKFFATPATSMYYLTAADMFGTSIEVRSAASAPNFKMQISPAAIGVNAKPKTLPQ